MPITSIKAEDVLHVLLGSKIIAAEIDRADGHTILTVQPPWRDDAVKVEIFTRTSIVVSTTNKQVNFNVTTGYAIAPWPL